MFQRLIGTIRDRLIIWKNTYKNSFHKQMWIACVSVCIPILLAGIFYYHYSIGQATSQIKNEKMSTLLLNSSNVEKALNDIERASFMLSNNPIIKNSFQNSDFHLQYFQHADLIDEMILVMFSNEMIGEIFYYNSDGQFAIDNNYGHIKTKYFNYREDISHAMSIEFKSGWIHLPDSSAKGYISFIRKLPMVFPDVYQGLLVFNVKESMINSLYLHKNDQNQIETFVISDAANILFSSQTATHDVLLHDTDFIDSIEKTEMKNVSSNAYQYESDDKIYTYLTTLSNRTYMSIVSNQEVTQQLKWIMISSLLSIILMIAMTVLLTWKNSKRLYTSIEELMHYGSYLSDRNIEGRGNEFNFIRDCFSYLKKETDILNRHILKVKPILREHFFLHLIERHYDNELTVSKECATYDLPFHSNYSVAVVKIYDDQASSGDTQNNNHLLAIQKAEKVIRQRLEQEKSIKGYVISSHQSKIIIAFNCSDDQSNEQISASINKINQMIWNDAYNKYGLSLSIGKGLIYQCITDLSLSYQEALLALRYRLLNENTRILDISKLRTNQKQRIFFYPQKFEDEMIEAIFVKANHEEAKAALTKFSDEIMVSESYNLILQSYQALLFSIICVSQKYGANMFDILKVNLFDQLSSYETCEQIKDWFVEKVFSLFISLDLANQQKKTDVSLAKICTYIQENASQDISLIQCADMVDMSPSYVSRLFKNKTGKSFAEFVQACKIEETKRLLKQTDTKIADIACFIGYSERNLYRKFLKLTNMSPSEFRARHR